MGPERLSTLLVMSCVSIYVARYLLYLLKCYLRDYCSKRILEIVSNRLFSFTIYIMSVEWRRAGVPHFIQQMYVQRRYKANHILNSAKELRKLKSSDISVI